VGECEADERQWTGGWAYSERIRGRRSLEEAASARGVKNRDIIKEEKTVAERIHEGAGCVPFGE